MSITITNSSVTIPSSAVTEQETDVAAASLAPSSDTTPSSEVASTSETMGLYPFSGFGMTSAALDEPGPYTIDELGSNLITFSKLPEAQKWVGNDVTTEYFRKYVENGVTYLEPLKAVRSKEVDYGNLSANQLTYVSAGAPIVYSATLPAVEDYLKLHSLEQIALAVLHGATKVVPFTEPRTGNLTFSELVFAAEGDGSATTVVVSQDSSKIYIVEKLQYRDIAIMSYENQLAISTTAAFEANKVNLGLEATQEEVLAVVQKAIDAIMERFPDTGSKSMIFTPVEADITRWQDSAITYTGGAVETVTDGRIGFLTTEHRDLFIKQLELLKDEILNDNAVFNLTPIKDNVAAISDRFQRALAFGNIPINLSSPDDASAAVALSEVYGGFKANSAGFNFAYDYENTQFVKLTGYSNLLSHDNNKTVKEGFDLFMAQEKIYYQNAVSKRELITSIKNNNMTLDAPALLYRLQTYYEISSAADIACETEMLRQQNDLLNSYAKAQQLISRTVALNKKTTLLGATATKSDNLRGVITDSAGTMPFPGGGKTVDIYEISYWDNETIKDISMFQTNNGVKGVTAPPHPIEVLRGIKRPTIDITGNDGNSKHGFGWAMEKTVTDWQQTANRFSDTVNLISQETQNALNKISGYEKDKGRYTDMASNTISKLLDALLSIGRGV